MLIKIRRELEEIADEKLRIFSLKLIPNANNVLGIRIPALRSIAKRLAKSGYQDYLNIRDSLYMEEVMLQGMVIGYLDLDWASKVVYIVDFVPRIDNWAVCDSFCTGLKFGSGDKVAVWDSLQQYLESDRAYEIRFAVVMLLSHFVDNEYAQRAFCAFDRIKNDDYYVRMAVAWAVSRYYRHMPEATLLYLRDNQLDIWTHNKAISKITESLAVSKQAKDVVRSMKRSKH